MNIRICIEENREKKKSSMHLVVYPNGNILTLQTYQLSSRTTVCTKDKKEIIL